jgi:hypothetical protein
MRLDLTSSMVFIRLEGGGQLPLGMDGYVRDKDPKLLLLMLVLL